MMITYLDNLKTLFEANRDPVKAGPMQAYMRDQFEFLGIKSPERKMLLREFFQRHGPPDIADLPAYVLELWAWPEREYQYAAQALIEKVKRKHLPAHIDLFEATVVQKSWWDTIDWTASHPVGDLFRRFPDLRTQTIARWRQSDNFWLRRVTLIFQLHYKDQTDEALLFELIGENLGSTEFFINKAIGWALREHSKRNADAVRQFVSQHDLAPLSRKEALKWLARRDKAT
jgi:3-methyladenine DNA glycosylase AlkD